MTPSYDDLLETAMAAATAAGRHAHDQSHRRREVHAQFEHDLKLQLDLEAQERADNVIHARYPDHAILGEEGSHERAQPRVRWIVDPIDGTINFSHGLPIWCSSVAAEVDGRVVAGAVYLPKLNEMYTATIERPATCNGKPIAPSTTDRMDRSMVLTGINKNIHQNPASMILFQDLVVDCFKVRILGAAAVDLCLVASGRADGYVEMGIHLWDVAAAALILQQAGGQYEVIEELGDHKMRVVASNGKIQKPLSALFHKTLERIKA